MDAMDMVGLQGFPKHYFKPKSCKVSSPAFRKMVGNSISVCVLMRYLPQVLYCAGLVESTPPDYWRDVVRHAKETGLSDRVPS